MTRPYESTGDDHLIAGGVKLFADGSGGARTAWMYDDWNIGVTGTDTGNRGYPNIEPDTLHQMIRMYHDAGFHIAIHAIGDRTIDLVVDSYMDALRANPKKGLRHAIIHANVPTEHAIETMAALQRDYDAGYPESSSTFMWWIGDTYAGNFGARARRLDPFATYLKRGDPLGERIGLQRHALRRALRALGRRRARAGARHLRRRSVWARRGRGHPRGTRAPPRSGLRTRCSSIRRSDPSKPASTPILRSGTGIPTRCRRRT